MKLDEDQSKGKMSLDERRAFVRSRVRRKYARGYIITLQCPSIS